MKSKQIRIPVGENNTSGVLILPDRAQKPGVLLAHGAGGNMHSDFIGFFHKKIAEAGYPSLKFNFLYSEARRKVPDPQPLLVSCYEQAIEAMPVRPVVIGGKSMGGRIASYLAEREEVAGLFFLGYPLHAPGKTGQLRDQHLYSIRKPMFFASGTNDSFARFDLLQSTLTRIETWATSFYIEGGGHSFDVPKKTGKDPQQIHQSVADALLRWLASLASGKL